MAKQSIDPAFQATPYLGDSSHDPLEFARRNNLTKYKYAASQEEERKKDFDKGLKDLTMEIKGWEDNQGFEEINKDLESIRDKYVELSSQGHNLTSPQTMVERRLYKGISTAMDRIKYKNDVWQEQKEQVRKAQDRILTELSTKQEEDRDLDVEATKANIEDLMATPGVLERNEKMANLVVNKARPVDISKYFMESIPKMVPGTDKLVKDWSMDPTTGKFIKTTWEGVDKKRAKSGILKIYDNAPKNIRNAVDKAYASDPEKGVMSKDEWVVNRFMPQYGAKEDKVAGGGSGAMSLNFNSGIPQKNANGQYDVQPQVRDIYFPTKNTEVTDDKKVYPYESIQRIPVGAAFGYKSISFMGSANNMNTTSGTKEGIGEAIPATPVEVNVLPVVTKPIEIKVLDPKTGKEVTETFNKGDMVPKHVLDEMRKKNAEAREAGKQPVYSYDYQAMVTMGLNYKQKKEDSKLKGFGDLNIYADASGRTQSYTETSIVPYDEVKQDLFAGASENKQNWKQYDDAIQEILNQVNGSTSKIKGIFEGKVKTTEEMFNLLEQ
jgi:hypothetical protein